MSPKITHNGARNFRPAFCRQESCPARAEDPFCALCGADIGAYLEAVGEGPPAGAVPEAPTPGAAAATTAPSARIDAAVTRELPVLVLPPHLGGGAANGNGNGNGHADRPFDDHGDNAGPDRAPRIALLCGGAVGAAMGVAGALALGLL
ncbi:MAG TPA: hypothetical protein VGV36_02215 [Solirubrobacteraceae bacterium]|nr:hypothetical protein [Solirubrobacteraceae bacterium]